MATLILTCPFCAKQFEIPFKHRNRRRYCSRSCASKATRNKWKGGRSKAATGRIRVHVDGKAQMGYEHVQIAEKVLGHPLPKGAEVHHHDRNPSNNVNSNLVICENHAYHSLLHSRTRILEAGGNPHTHKICGRCKQVLPRENFSRHHTKCDGLDVYCRSCVSIRHFEKMKRRNAS